MEVLNMELTIWNILLSAAMAGIGYVLKDKSDELKRIDILLNKTREEVAKEYVTKVDVHLDINRVLDRLDRMEQKLDAVIRENRSAIG
jgi:Tfp pilus assembly protein PilO